MEPASLALAAFTSFKEVYLVSRFVYRVNVSRRNATPERKLLQSKFRYEVLFLQSLGHCFFRSGDIVDNAELNKRWWKQVYEIIERMRLLLGDYSRIAAEEDDTYKYFSPFLNSSMFDTKAIEFDINEGLPEPANSRPISFRALRWLGIKAGQKVNENLDDWKWALVEKRRFEHVLASLQEENSRLKDVLPLISMTASSNSRTHVKSQSPILETNDDTRRLGLAAHAQLREITSSAEYRKEIQILKEGLRPVALSTGSPLVVCEVAQHQSISKQKIERVLVEYKHYLQLRDSTEEEIQIDRQRAHQLARLLASAGENDLATLSFRGLQDEPDAARHIFTFHFPPGTDTLEGPVSLWNLIDTNRVDTRLDLSRRFQVAEALAKTIGGFHADGWVHKSLRSESVIFFYQENTMNLLVRFPYLVNFEYSRPQGAGTKLEFDNDCERNLYRHPDRQGEPRISFTRLHDLYALGVVLLEIGLWQTVSSMVKEVQVRSGGQRSVTNILKQLTKRRLSHHMGPTYAEAVLSCIDDRYEHRISNADFPMVFHDEVIRKLDVRALWNSQ
ncbi:hypothetical protein K469DRAFT_667957 [Zopfia rhizophila CBS 207.26]|uniref:Protein kinase domain-containing protein n=1 Tax=Zopfia rhizophila CBS 207.26 TaxID=1314779 RepID=A0A6A6DY49_9PEZI|nr:hypothetical protein K469DRAFT_667957 [Zopfia rhizophila CBS 207.26]